MALIRGLGESLLVLKLCFVNHHVNLHQKHVSCVAPSFLLGLVPCFASSFVLTSVLPPPPTRGESISIADASGEVWIMEIIGRGPTYGRGGAVWVARRVPDGMVTAHANQARITTFPRDDPENCLFARDVVDVAVHYGLYSRSSPEAFHTRREAPNANDSADFSFSDVYDPVGFSGARFSEGRVWSMLSKVADEDGSFELEYQDYAAGRNLEKRMPLFVKPYKKLSLVDVMDLMNSHYEGTELDATVDVGGGIFGSPHRPRPLTWEYQGRQYFNERTLATERTGWNFVAQIRPGMPTELAALIWFAVDDSSTSPRVPVYASSTKVAEPYAGKGTQDGVPGPMLKLDMTKAFWGGFDVQMMRRDTAATPALNSTH